MLADIVRQEPARPPEPLDDEFRRLLRGTYPEAVEPTDPVQSHQALLHSLFRSHYGEELARIVFRRKKGIVLVQLTNGSTIRHDFHGTQQMDRDRTRWQMRLERCIFLRKAKGLMKSVITKRGAQISEK